MSQTVKSFMEVQASWSLDLAIELAVVAFSNFIGLIPVWRSARVRRYANAAYGFFCVFTSFMYHFSETYFDHVRSTNDVRLVFWGMTPGSWHRLDNVAVIVGLQSLIMFVWNVSEDEVMRFMNTNRGSGRDTKDSADDESEDKAVEIVFIPDMTWFHSRRMATEGMMVLLLLFAVVCQEIAPWDEFYTFLPILSTFLIALPRYYLFTPKQLRPQFDWSSVWSGLGCLGLGIMFFIFGLNDKEDPWRIFHGLWHVFASVGLNYLIDCHVRLDAGKLWSVGYCPQAVKDQKGTRRSRPKSPSKSPKKKKLE